MSRTLSAVKRRVWTLLGINIVGAAVAVLGIIALLAAILFQLSSVLIGLNDEPLDTLEPWLPILWTSGIGFPIVVFIAQIAQAKAALVTIAGADRLLAGERPTFSEMWRDSSGSLRRSIPLLILVLLFSVLMVLPYIGLVVYLSLVVGQGGDPDQGAIVAVGFLVTMFFSFVMVFVQLYVMIRWVYVGQFLTLEKAGAFDSLRRSWRLTSRDFWRTFGVLLVGYLMVMAISSAASMIGAGLSFIPSAQLSGQLESLDGTDSIEAFISALVTLFIVMVMQTIVSAIATAIANAFFIVYVTAMYRDQVYRDSLRERGIDPAHVALMQQGSPPPYPVGQPSPPPYAPGQPHAAPTPNAPWQNPENSPWAQN